MYKYHSGISTEPQKKKNKLISESIRRIINVNQYLLFGTTTKVFLAANLVYLPYSQRWSQLGMEKERGYELECQREETGLQR